MNATAQRDYASLVALIDDGEEKDRREREALAVYLRHLTEVDLPLHWERRRPREDDEDDEEEWPAAALESRSRPDLHPCPVQGGREVEAIRASGVREEVPF